MNWTQTFSQYRIRLLMMPLDSPELSKAHIVLDQLKESAIRQKIVENSLIHDDWLETFIIKPPLWRNKKL